MLHRNNYLALAARQAPTFHPRLNLSIRARRCPSLGQACPISSRPAGENRRTGTDLCLYPPTTPDICFLGNPAKAGSRNVLFLLEVWAAAFARMTRAVTNLPLRRSGRAARGGYLSRVTFCLRRPAFGLTLVHPLLWPLIFAQGVALKNQVRARYGRGVPYACVVSRWGRVPLTFASTQGFARFFCTRARRANRLQRGAGCRRPPGARPRC